MLEFHLFDKSSSQKRRLFSVLVGIRGENSLILFKAKLLLQQKNVEFYNLATSKKLKTSPLDLDQNVKTNLILDLRKKLI